MADGEGVVVDEALAPSCVVALEDGIGPVRGGGDHPLRHGLAERGEQVIAAEPNLDYAIVRPAIVETSVAKPFTGWNEGINTSASLSYLLGTSFRQLPTNEKKRLDIIPVDSVCRGIVYTGNLARFEQDAGMRAALLATGARVGERIDAAGAATGQGHARATARAEGHQRRAESPQLLAETGELRRAAQWPIGHAFDRPVHQRGHDHRNNEQKWDNRRLVFLHFNLLFEHGILPAKLTQLDEPDEQRFVGSFRGCRGRERR